MHKSIESALRPSGELFGTPRATQELESLIKFYKGQSVNATRCARQWRDAARVAATTRDFALTQAEQHEYSVTRSADCIDRLTVRLALLKEPVK